MAGVKIQEKMSKENALICVIQVDYCNIQYSLSIEWIKLYIVYAMQYFVGFAQYPLIY